MNTLSTMIVRYDFAILVSAALCRKNKICHSHSYSITSIVLLWEPKQYTDVSYRQDPQR